MRRLRRRSCRRRRAPHGCTSWNRNLRFVGASRPTPAASRRLAKPFRRNAHRSHGSLRNRCGRGACSAREIEERDENAFELKPKDCRVHSLRCAERCQSEVNRDDLAFYCTFSFRFEIGSDSLGLVHLDLREHTKPPRLMAQGRSKTRATRRPRQVTVS